MTDTTNEDRDGKKMPLMDHLIELRQRLVYSLLALLVSWVVCYYFSGQIYNFLVEPLAKALVGKPGHHLIYTALTEAFITRIKVSFWTACFIAFPLIEVQIWIFVAPGLYQNERKAFLPYLAATPVLFLMGGALAYYVVIPQAWRFFLSFETAGGPGSLPIEADPKVSEYLSLVLNLIFAFGIAFQLPVGLTLLARVGIISSDFLKRNWRYAIVIIFAAAAVLSPPDALSMTGLAVPMCLLYVVSIWSCQLVERQRAERNRAAGLEDDDDDDDDDEEEGAGDGPTG
jgi:sec-independent protein translocase protein TatC